MGLPDGRKCFKIGFHTISACDGQPASHVAVAYTRYAYLRRAVYNNTNGVHSYGTIGLRLGEGTAIVRTGACVLSSGCLIVTTVLGGGMRSSPSAVLGTHRER